MMNSDLSLITDPEVNDASAKPSMFTRLVELSELVVSLKYLSPVLNDLVGPDTW